jgi:D-beta-D-heptose 7-phosphate kinase/D-beta-D-heptose 1-phosphate adenosyltransferase
MVKLLNILAALRPVRILVLGDFMLDTYSVGKVWRISPEAPVGVLNIESEQSRPGGAGNVAVNILACGSEVVTVGRIGNDPAGAQLQDLLIQEGSRCRFFLQPGYATPMKNRFIADAQQILRVDREFPEILTRDLEERVLCELPELLEGVEIISISDYAKGFVTHRLLQRTMQLARQQGILVIVDPKGTDFRKYDSSHILKPNSKEAYAAAGLPPDTSLEEVAEQIFLKSQVEKLLITRSEAGMSLFERHDNRRYDFPVISREVKDVTGAGDTVLAFLSIALASGLDLHAAIHLANLAAGIAVERVGCARIMLKEIAAQIFQRDPGNKVFEQGQLVRLRHLLSEQSYCLLDIEYASELSIALFRVIRMLDAQHLSCQLVIYLRREAPEEEFVAVLSSLSEVDFVVLSGTELDVLVETLQPSHFYCFQEGQLIRQSLSRVVLETYPS